MIYHQRQDKKQSYTFFFFIIILLIGTSFFIWNKFYTPEGYAKDTSVIEKGGMSVVRLGESANFVEIQGVEKLLEGESIQSKFGNTTLVFFDRSSLTLDGGAIVDIIQTREREKDSSVSIEISVNTGRIWLHVSQKVNPRSEFILKTQNFSFTTRGGEFSVDQNSVVAITGSGTVAVGKTFLKDVEIGQSIIFSEDDFLQIVAGGQGPEKTGISPDFQNSEWFLQNTEKTILSNETDDEKESDAEIITPEIEESDDEVSFSHASVFILFPGNNNDVVEVKKDTVPISGTVPDGTKKVTINDYSLKRFTPGDTTFKYNASVDLGTLKKGENKYNIIALGENEEKYEATITLVYTPEPKEDSESKEEIQPNGELTISSPKEGEKLSEETILVTGKAPKNAASIVVNDYKLSLFLAGNTTWNYKIADVFGNRTMGENIITVKALDAEGNVIDTKQVTIIIKPIGGASKYAPELRGSTFPPVKQDDFGEPTI